MDPHPILSRIERDIGIPNLADLLSSLPPTDLQSLLLEVYRLRAGRLQPAAVLASFAADRFVRPSGVSPLALLRWEQTAFSHLPAGFQPLALSPVAPLGACSVVAGVDQNWAVATERNSEVVSDSTNVLALECALRRRDLLRADPKSTELVLLAASQRLLRAQAFSGPLQLAHFSLFALGSAGRDPGGLQFELSALGTHIRFYLGTLRAFLGPGVPLRVALTDFRNPPRLELLETRLLEGIRAGYGGVELVFDQERVSGRGYYQDLCFHVYAANPSGQFLELADGGCVDWTQKYLSSAKERLVISGIGSERVCTQFKSGNRR